FFARQADFIESIVGVHYHHMLTAQAPENFGHWFTQRAVEYTYHLALNVCGISHGAKHITDGAQAQLLARTNGETHGAVMRGRKHKTDTDFLYAARNLFRSNIQFNPRSFQHIGTTG